MLKRIRSFFRNASLSTESKPASSTFGAGADRQRSDQERTDNWDKEVAIEKGRIKGF